VRGKLLLLATLLLGCSLGEDAAGLDDEVRLVVSGGVVGTVQELVVDAEGQATITRAGGSVRTFQLSDDQFARLVTLLDATDLDELAAYAGELQVADDLLFELTYGDHEVVVEESNLPDDYPPLLSHLTGLLKQGA
jgi:hypothetical protein